MAADPNPQQSAAEIETAIGAIYADHAEGLSDAQHRYRHGRPGTRSEKEKLAKSRSFASPVTGYSREELSAVLDQCRAAGWVMTRSHFIRLITVPKGAVSQNLQDEVIAGKWSSKQLGRVIRDRFGNRKPKAGRPPVVTDWQSARTQMIRLAEQWAHLRSRREVPEDPPADNERRYKLPPWKKLEDQLTLVDNALRGLRELLEQQAGRARSKNR